jgi:hypothetical protein
MYWLIVWGCFLTGAALIWRFLLRWGRGPQPEPEQHRRL